MNSILLVLLVPLCLLLGAFFGHWRQGQRLATLEQSLLDLQNRLAASSQGEHSAALEAARLQEQLRQAEKNHERLLAEKAEALHQRNALESELRQQSVQLAEISTRLHAAQEQLQAERQLLQGAQQQLGTHFENLAQKIFEEKSRKFTEQNQLGLDGVLNPLREQLKDFRDKVDKAYSSEASERAVLKEHLTRLESLNRQISDDAVNLTKALKGDSKLQGNWGEMILERVLEESGLRRGHEYETQFSSVNEDGQRLIPDVIVRLPEGRDIIIDSKVSLLAYERYCSSEDALEREAALKAHVLSLRTHMRGLSAKAYEHIKEIRTLDFVFIFMPIEAAFMLAVEHDASLFSEAFAHKIIIVSPTTLLATLRTVESIWRYERQSKNAEEIARQAGQLHDKFVGFIDNMKRIGNSLNQSQIAYEDALKQLSEGRGNLVNGALKLQKLGAKTKKQLPGELVELDKEMNTAQLPGLDAPDDDSEEQDPS
jgi:DNA recombination protein RmuC